MSKANEALLYFASLHIDTPRAKRAAIGIGAIKEVVTVKYS